MKITSPVFENNESIPSKYTCDGENINPPLEFIDVPEEAKSLVIIMDDPDTVRLVGYVWSHWIVWNIPVGIKTIAENSVPPGVVGPNTRNNHAYGGPCPPDTEHHYFFRLYALDIVLDISEDSTKQDLEKVIEEHIVARAELVGLYNRK